MSDRPEGQVSRTDTQPPQLQEQAHHSHLTSTYDIWDRMPDEPHAFTVLFPCAGMPFHTAYFQIQA